MLLKEDYFNELDVIDTDCCEIDDTAGLTISDIKGFIDRYDRYVTFTLETQMLDSIPDQFWQSTLHNIIERIEYILEWYNIEHSEIFLADWMSPHSICNTYRYKDHTIFSRHDEDEFYNTKMEICITVFVNYPQFAYKDVYGYLYKMLSIVMNSKYVESLIMFPNTSKMYTKGILRFSYRLYSIVYEMFPGYDVISLDHEYIDIE